MGQKQNGTTVNVTISTTKAGVTSVLFQDPFSMEVSLGMLSGVVVKGAPDQDRFLLSSSTGNTITGGSGNDIFVVSPTAADLGGNVLKGGSGVNIIQLKGSNAEIDLTGALAGVAASTGIDAVVASKAQSGEIVDMSLSDLAGSSLTGGGAGPGKAFVALIGRDGTVNFNTGGIVKFVGVLDASGAGFAADGTPLDSATTAALASEVTAIDDVQGSLASMYTGAGDPAHQAYVPENLGAYVFSAGAKFYTLWTDGAVNQILTSTGDTTTLFQTAPAASPNPQFGQIQLFDPTTSGSAALTTTASGATSVSLTKEAPGATGAIVITGQATGTIVHGGGDPNGGDWFNLANSGGSNLIVGTPGNDTYELAGSSALIDTLNGRTGFDIVHSPTDGADIDLTGLSTGVRGSTGIDAVVGNGRGAQTVEVSLSSLAATRDASGNRTSVFEAFLGSSSDTLTLSGTGKWQQIATINPGDALPTGATALTDASLLDAAFNGAANSGKAENTLVGNLFELVGHGGVAVRYATIWTDATIVSPFPSAVTSMVQAMAQQPSGPAMSASVTDPTSTYRSATLLASPTANA